MLLRLRNTPQQEIDDKVKRLSAILAGKLPVLLCIGNNGIKRTNDASRTKIDLRITNKELNTVLVSAEDLQRFMRKEDTKVWETILHAIVNKTLDIYNQPNPTYLNSNQYSR